MTAPEKHLPQQNLIHNTGRVMATLILANASMVVMNWALICAYGKAHHAEATILISLTTMAVLMCDLGIASKAGVRHIARQRQSSPANLNDTLMTYLTILIAVALLAGAVLLCAADRVAGFFNTAPPLIRLAAVWVMCGALTRAYAMVAVGFERMGYLVLFTLSSEVLRCVWVGVCWLLRLPFSAVYLGWTCIWLLAVIIGAVLVRQLVTAEQTSLFARLPAIGTLSRTVLASLPYLIPNLSGVGLPALTSLLLGALSPGLVSLMQVYFTFALVSRLVSQPLATALFPLAARMHLTDAAGNGDLARIMNQVVRVLGLVSSTIFAAALIAGEPLLRLLYGEPYAAGLPALLILVLAVGLDCYRMQVDQMLMAAGHAAVSAYMEITKLCLLPLTIALLAPAYAAAGAAGAVLLSVAVPTAIRLQLARRRSMPLGLRPLAGLLGSAALIVAVAQLTGSALCTAGAWAAGIFIFRLLRSSDIQLFLKSIKAAA